jgi:hypothetical protein
MFPKSIFKELTYWQKGGVIGFLIALIFVIGFSVFARFASQSSPDGHISFFLAFLVSFPVYIIPATIIGSVLGWIYKKTHSKILVSIIIGGVIVIPYLFFVLISTNVGRFCETHEECQVPAASYEPQVSPSGEYVLEVLEGYDEAEYIQFRVKTNGSVNMNAVTQEMVTIEFAPKEKYYTRHRTYVMWDDVYDRVWVYSGDIGMFFWDKIDTEYWAKHTCIQRGTNFVDTPIFLKEKLSEWASGCSY